MSLSSLFEVTKKEVSINSPLMVLRRYLCLLVRPTGTNNSVGRLFVSLFTSQRDKVVLVDHVFSPIVGFY